MNKVLLLSAGASTAKGTLILIGVRTPEVYVTIVDAVGTTYIWDTTEETSFTVKFPVTLQGDHSVATISNGDYTTYVLPTVIRAIDITEPVTVYIT